MRFLRRPEAVWGSLFALGGTYELYALLNDTEGDTLSEVTRDVFDVQTRRGKVMFTGLYAGFSLWFVPHIAAAGIKAAEEVADNDPGLAGRVARRVLWPTA